MYGSDSGLVGDEKMESLAGQLQASRNAVFIEKVKLNSAGWQAGDRVRE